MKKESELPDQIISVTKRGVDEQRCDSIPTRLHVVVVFFFTPFVYVAKYKVKVILLSATLLHLIIKTYLTTDVR